MSLHKTTKRATPETDIVMYFQEALGFAINSGRIAGENTVEYISKRR